MGVHAVPVGYGPGARPADQGDPASRVSMNESGVVARPYGVGLDYEPEKDPKHCQDGECKAFHTKDSPFCIGHKRSRAALDFMDGALAELEGS